MTSLMLKLSLGAMVIAFMFGFAHPGSSNEVASGQALFSNLLWIVSCLIAVAANLLGSHHPTRNSVVLDSVSRWLLASFFGCIGLVMLSSFWQGSYANHRFAINSAWQWATGGFILLNCIAVGNLLPEDRGRFLRRFFVLGLAIVWCQSMHGGYQKLIEIPSDIARYEADPVAVLREAGLQAEKDSAIDFLYRGRLYDASPTATYSLTNSFAIVLAVSLVMMFALLGRTVFQSHKLTFLLFVLVLVPIALCLFWTKSRTAWLACLIGIGIVVFSNPRLQLMIRAHWRRNLAASLAVLLGLGLLVFLWDRSILLGALNSLLYRSSYWWTACEIAKDHPWLGVGSGNFQDYYAEYRPLMSAETVSDPHSLWFETLVAGGPLATLLLVIAMVASLVKLTRVEKAEDDRTDCDDQAKSDESDISMRTARMQELSWDGLAFSLAVAVGALLPWVTFYYTGAIPDPTTYVFSAPMAGVLAYALFRQYGLQIHFPRSTLLACVATYLVCLTFAGGWVTPGVSNGLFLWIGLAFWGQAFQGKMSSPESALTKRPWQWAFGASLVTATLFVITSWLPVRAAQVALESLQDSRQAPTKDQLLELVNCDTKDPLLWRQAAAIEQLRCISVLGKSNMQVSRQSEFFAAFEQFNEGMVQRNQQSWQAWTQRGHWRFELAAYQNEWLPLAIADYEHAIQLYPGDVDVLMQAALAHYVSGDWTRASERLAEAEKIDRETVHFERRIFTGVIYWPTAWQRLTESKANIAGDSDERTREMAEKLWERGRQLAGSDPSRLKAEPLALAMRKLLDSLKEN